MRKGMVTEDELRAARSRGDREPPVMVTEAMPPGGAVGAPPLYTDLEQVQREDEAVGRMALLTSSGRIAAAPTGRPEVPRLPGSIVRC